MKFEEKEDHRTFDYSKVSVNIEGVGILRGGEGYGDRLIAKLAVWTYQPKHLRQGVTGGSESVATVELYEDHNKKISFYMETGWSIDGATGKFDQDFHEELHDFLWSEYQATIIEKIREFVTNEIPTSHPDYVKLRKYI